MLVLVISSLLASCQAIEGPYLASPPGTRPDCLPMDTTYCEDIDNYPGALIAMLLTKSNLSVVFTDERKGLQEPPRELYLGRPMARRGYPYMRATRSADCQYDPFCPVEIRTVYPKAAVDQNGIWKFVNKTAVVTKLCRKIEGSGRKTYQQYTIKKLYAFDGFNKVKPDWFIFPSCCRCSFEN